MQPFPALYGLDIETDTTIDGLDPAVASIVAVALVGAERSWHWSGNESETLAGLDSVISKLGPAVLVTWNGSRFDLPYIATRASRCDVPLGLDLRMDPKLHSTHDPLPGHQGAYRARWWECGHLDGYRLYRNDVARVLGISCGLKAVSKAVGLTPVEVDRALVHELGADELSAYVHSDAKLTRELVLRRLPGARGFIDRF